MAGSAFATAREVFEAFPSARADIRAAPNDVAPAAFLRSLAASDTPEDAITFCAYALGPREAVWWGARCVRALLGIAAGEEDASLRSAEAWLRRPVDGGRDAARALARDADRRAPTTWLALAAAGSEDGAPPTTRQAVRTAILMALARIGARERGARLRSCVEAGLELIDGRRSVAD